MDTPRPRVLVRSDSQGTSLGEGTVDPHDPRLWAALVAGNLAGRGQPVELRNASSAGLTIRQALAGFRSEPLIRQPTMAADTVILGLGINDWWPLARPRRVADWMDRARPLLVRRALRKGYAKLRPRLLVLTRGGFRPTPPGEARQDLTALVGEIKAIGRHVLLVTPFPVRSPKNPHLDGNTWEACDTVVAVGQETGVPVVDCRTLFQPIQWETISIDHIHVNEGGQRVIADAVTEALLSHGLLEPTGVSPEGFASPAATPLLHRRDIDIHEELRQVQHDPLVREAYLAAESVMIGLPDRRLSRWDAERLQGLVHVIHRTNRLAVVAPPARRAEVAAALKDVPNPELPVPVVDDLEGVEPC